VSEIFLPKDIKIC